MNLINKLTEQKISRRTALQTIGVIGATSLLSLKDKTLAQEQEAQEKYHGFCYGPFRKNEDPDKGIYPAINEIEEDITLLSKFTERIRTYGNNSSLAEIPAICQRKGLECYLGAWLGDGKRLSVENEREIQDLIRIANSGLRSLKGLIVGNEVLLRRDLSKEELSDYINRVKRATNIPIGTAEIWGVLKQNPDIVKNIDFLLVHIHPYWEGISAEDAANYVIKRFEEIRGEFPGKELIIGETGWPSKGEIMGQAVPNEKNQKIFFEEFVRLSKEKRIPYFYFEAFDEPWKIKFEGGCGAYWGIFSSDGSIKPLFKESFPQEASEGIKRPAKILEKKVMNAPVFVYIESNFAQNSFEPSGYMGDLKSIFINKNYKEQPYSGKTCTEIIYKPTIFNSWAGVYWQYPINNWGEAPGYEIKGASKLTFLARGKYGTETAEFKTGGINRFPHHDPQFKYKDSFGPLTTRPLRLTQNWRKYRIDLRGQDLSNTIGGFCWVTNNTFNPRGCTIYLDDIVIE